MEPDWLAPLPLKALVSALPGEKTPRDWICKWPLIIPQKIQIARSTILIPNGHIKGRTITATTGWHNACGGSGG